MDPDDILMNQDLFKELFIYNQKFNLDIIEFMVYHQEEGKNNMIFPKPHWLNHFHNFDKNIISQIICRTIWNKLIRKEIMLNAINYLNNDYFKNQFLIAADDTPINILAFQFANNYSNVKIPGYLYILREEGMSSDNKGNIKHDIILSYNFLLYFKFLYRYVKKFKKNLNFFVYDFKPFSVYLRKLKDLNATEYIPMALKFFRILSRRRKIKLLNQLVDELIKYFLKS